MLNKVMKLCAVALVGVSLFLTLPFNLYAYYNSIPAVTTGNATNISPMNATFNGSVSSVGLSVSAWFEYGTDVNFGNSTSLNAFISNNGYGGNYSTNVSGLTANTTYYFRAVAQNSQGRVSGNVSSFTTNFSNLGYNNLNSPTAVTTSGVILADSAAQFNSLILLGNTSKADTYFEWGTTPNLGNQTVTIPVSGAPAIRHTNTITGLAAGTTYYFRAVAQNAYGRSDGTILSLTTSGKVQVQNNQNNTVQKETTPTNTDTTTTTKITSTDSTAVDKSVDGSSPASPVSSPLGANAFSSGSFFPSTLFAWLILLILVLVLIFLSKHAHSQFKK